MPIHLYSVLIDVTNKSKLSEVICIGVLDHVSEKERRMLKDGSPSL